LPYFRHLILSFQIEPNDINKLDENVNIFLSYALLFKQKPLTVRLNFFKSKNVVNFVIELRKLFALMLKSKRKAINPNPTLRCLRNCSKYDVDTFNQEDVSEFATILVNLIEESFDILSKLQHSQTKNKDASTSSLLDSTGAGVSLAINNLSLSTFPDEIRKSSTLDSKESELLASNNFNIRPIGEKTTLAIATANTLANNLRKNRKNPIVNLLNGDILINRKNSGIKKTSLYL